MQIEDVIKSLRIVVSWELTERMEYTKTETGKILGVTPATISHYSSGKRGSNLAGNIRSSRKTHKIAAELADILAEDYRKGRALINTRLIEASQKILPLIENKSITHQKTDTKMVNRILRSRLIEEQKSATECSSLGELFNDNALKKLIETLEIDSIRHAEIVSLLMERSNSQEFDQSFRKSDIKTIEQLTKMEEAADDDELSELKPILDPLSKVLIESIEADERKHSEILRAVSKIMKESVKR